MDAASPTNAGQLQQSEEQPNLQSLLHSESTVQPCSARIPRQVDKLVPSELIWNGRCTTTDQYIALCTATYNLLTIKQVTRDGEEKQFLQFKFLQDLLPTDLQMIRNSTPDLANLNADMVGLFRLLETVKRGLNGLEAQVVLTIVSKFTNPEVNDVLEKSCERQGDDKLNQEYKFLLFIKRFIPNALVSIRFIHRKARLAIEFYYEVEHLKQDIGRLKNQYQLMLTSLQNRATVNNLSHHVMGVKEETMAKLVQYAKFWDKAGFDNMFTFQTENHVYAEFCFDESEAENFGNFTSWIIHKMYYSHFLYKDDIIPETTTLFYGVTEDMDPILTGIRQFTPSPLEIAKEKAAFMKPDILKIKAGAEEFLNLDSGKSIGKAKSLMEQITVTRGDLRDLKMSGLLANDETIGISSDELEDFYIQICNSLEQMEHDAKIAEIKARAASRELARGTPQLQLPDLTGFSAWLNFKKAINDIMPLHSNSLIKKQLLLKSLKNKDDHSRCLGISYEDGFKYLVKRYESSSLIPGLLEELTRLTPPANVRQAYENLTKLVSTISMIQSYDQIDKLDSNTRSKLTFILIPAELQLDYLKDQSIFEEDIKKTYCPDLQDLDALSEASCLQTQEIETKRRDWWLQQMNRYLYISREFLRQTSESVKKNKQYSFSTNEDYECALCEEQHIYKGIVLLSLSRCPVFKRMDVAKRIASVDLHGFCKKCLRSKSNGQHFDGCKFAREKKITCRKCDPPTTSHHPMLHWEKQVLSNPDEQNYYSSNPDDYDDDEQNSDEQNYLSSNPDECDESNQDEEEVMY